MDDLHPLLARDRANVVDRLMAPPKAFSSQDGLNSSIFCSDRGPTQGSEDSGYSSVGHRDDAAKSGQKFALERPPQHGLYEQSFYAVPEESSEDADATHGSRASSVETCDSPGTQIITVPRPAKSIFRQGGTPSGKLTTSSAHPEVVSPPTNEASNDSLSSRPTETSTPESDSSWPVEYSDTEDVTLEKPHPFMLFKNSAVALVLKTFFRWQESLLEQDTPCDGASKAYGELNQDKGKAKDSASGKRKWGDRLEQNRGTLDNSERWSTQTTDTSSKRRRTADRNLTFACPYTKKDPMSYRDCYRYKLSRIRDVKQHLDRCHRNPPYCPRCRGTFRTEEERDEHIRDISCPMRPPTAFGGITEAQKEQLRRKSASNTSVEAQWFVVFDILFPGHDPRPQSPYIDAELLQDITLYQDYLTTNGPRILSYVLSQRGAITWNLPNEERDLAAFQQTVLEEGLRAVFHQWVARRGPTRDDLNVSSNSGTSIELTPPSSSNSGEGAGSNSNHAPEAPPPGIIATLPGRVPTNSLTGVQGAQEASMGRDLPNEGENVVFNRGQDGIDFYQELPYGAPDDELWGMVLGVPEDPSFQPALG